MQRLEHIIIIYQGLAAMLTWITHHPSYKGSIYKLTRCKDFDASFFKRVSQAHRPCLGVFKFAVLKVRLSSFILVLVLYCAPEGHS